jgi:hypothetical protein
MPPPFLGIGFQPENEFINEFSFQIFIRWAYKPANEFNHELFPIFIQREYKPMRLCTYLQD